MRSPDLLHPLARRRVDHWLERCRADDLDVLVYCTARSIEEQAVLYRYNRPYLAIEAMHYKLKRWGLVEAAEILMNVPAQGGKAGKKKTNAPPGMSFHQPHEYQGHVGAFAVDFVVIEQGKPRWDDGALFKAAGTWAEGESLTWSGRWLKFREVGHIQWDDLKQINILKLARGKYA